MVFPECLVNVRAFIVSWLSCGCRLEFTRFQSIRFPVFASHIENSSSDTEILLNCPVLIYLYCPSLHPHCKVGKSDFSEYVCTSLPGTTFPTKVVDTQLTSRLRYCYLSAMYISQHFLFCLEEYVLNNGAFANSRELNLSYMHTTL